MESFIYDRYSGSGRGVVNGLTSPGRCAQGFFFCAAGDG